MSFRLRPATPADVPEIHEQTAASRLAIGSRSLHLWRSSWAGTTIPTFDSPQDIRVVEADGRLVGYGNVWYRPSDSQPITRSHPRGGRSCASASVGSEAACSPGKSDAAVSWCFPDPMICRATYGPWPVSWRLSPLRSTSGTAYARCGITTTWRSVD